MPRHPSHILELAKRGAEARVRELIDELKLLAISFPHLRDSFDKDELPISFILKKGAGRPGTRQALRRRRRMSAAARAKISAAQKKRWAARRKAKKKGGETRHLRDELSDLAG